MNNPISYLILLLPAFAYALDEDSAKERRCFDTKTDPNISFEWLQSVEKWYFPTWSKLELFRTASDILEKPIAEIPVAGLYETACGSCNKNFQCGGFNHSLIPYAVSVDETGVFTFKAATKYARGGTHTLVLSDNKNYIVGITCWDDNESSYGIWTPMPTLSTKDKETVVNYLQKLGYNMDFIVDTPYDKCTSKILEQKSEL